MVAKNIEIEEAVSDLITLVTSYPLHATTETVDQKDIDKLVSHFSERMYKAVLKCTQNSLNLVKNRISVRPGAFTQVKPFFDVCVELQLPEVMETGAPAPPHLLLT